MPRPSALDPRPSLSTAAIVAAARTIADTEGVAELTLRRVAAEFDTGQASLYRHIGGRAELLALLAEDVAAEFPMLPAGPSARAAVIRQWRANHDHLVRHPWAARLIAEGSLLAHGADRFADHAVEQLRRAGLGRADARRAYQALWQLLLGHLLNNHPFGHSADSAPSTRDDWPIADFRWSLDRMVTGLLPRR